MRILFVSRSLQSSPGGMQLYAASLIAGLRGEGIPVSVCGYGGAKIFLPLFLGLALVRCVSSQGTHIHFGDAVFAPFIPVLRVLRPGLKLSVTVYGLDLTHRNSLYQRMLRLSLPSAEKVIAISAATAREAEKRGATKASIVVIPCGIDVGSPPIRRVANKQLLLLGRQIPRKGARWFVQNVVPRLRSQVPGLTVVIAGDGPELSGLRSDADRLGLEGIVTLRGEVSGADKRRLFAESTLFLMPNMPVPGDMEGFGLVCIEAAAAGLPCIAADIDGIPDAVIDGVTGLLYPAGDSEDCAQTVIKAMSISWYPEAIYEAFRQHYDIKKMISRYQTDVFH